MASQGEAFAPGHVTAFFVGYDDPDPMKKGSRGAGLCTTLGVHTVARVRAARAQSIEVYINDERAKAGTSERAAKLLLGDGEYEVMLLQKMQLPVSHGFGMSGAGALSTVLALDEALGSIRPWEELVGIAHRADVESFTGLGDVMPQAMGGMDLRMTPGGPPPRKGDQRVAPAQMEEADAGARVEPAVGVVDVREGFLELPLLAEVLRVLAVRAGHGEEVLRDLPEVGLGGWGDLDLRKGPVGEGDVLVDKGSEIQAPPA